MLKLADGDELLKIAEAVSYTKTAHQSLYQAIREGRLVAEGTHPYLIRRSELDRWMAARDAKRDRPPQEPG